MPQMANITVKASNGTTDVIYVAAQPSSGDKTPARWTVTAASNIFGYRPTATMLSENNGAGNGRRFRMGYKLPITATENGVLVFKGNLVGDMQITIPTNVDLVAAKEGYYQFGNLAVSSLWRAAFDDGYAPT